MIATTRRRAFCAARGSTFVHPFDDLAIVEGAGHGGPGNPGNQLISGRLTFASCPSAAADWLRADRACSGSSARAPGSSGCSRLGAPSMHDAIAAGRRQALASLDTFVDGAAVKCPGELTFGICRALLDEVRLVPEGQVCEDLLKMYNEEGMVLEPAGTLAISALHAYADQIRGKTVVCVISGSNNDITRMEDIKERASAIRASSTTLW
ncbi:MAG: pyridoxal-phosphate dependent enzyme [Hymenobacter sp.]